MNPDKKGQTFFFYPNDIHLNFSIRLFQFLLLTFFLFPSFFFLQVKRGNARGRGDRRDVQRLGTYWDGDQSTRSGDTAGRIFRRVLCAMEGATILRVLVLCLLGVTSKFYVFLFLYNIISRLLYIFCENSMVCSLKENA